MSITVKIDGKFQETINGVTPPDVKIIGRKLSVKGVLIPINENLIFQAFRVLEHAANSQCGTLYIEIRVNGEVKYCDETSTHGVINWAIERIVCFGTIKHWNNLYNYGSSSIPNNDTYMVGKYKHDTY
jgi:hypothetical protein